MLYLENLFWDFGFRQNGRKIQNGVKNIYIFVILHSKLQFSINRKFRVATEIGSTFFGCCSVTGQLKK
jgi:hypothetical protein